MNRTDRKFLRVIGEITENSGDSVNTKERLYIGEELLPFRLETILNLP